MRPFVWTRVDPECAVRFFYGMASFHRVAFRVTDASVTVLKAWWGARPRLSTAAGARRLDLFLVAALSIASGASVVLVWPQPLVADACSHLEMAQSLATNGTLSAGPSFSHFYPPAYPTVLALFGSLMGFDKNMVHTVQAVLLALTTASAFFVGSQFDRRVGLLAAAFTAANPVLLAEAGQGRATVMAALLMLWTLHFVVKGLRVEAALGWAGLFAGLLYLTKDTTGFVALIGLFVGFAWRTKDMGLRAVLASAHYRLAGVFFAASYGGWAARNLVRFGSPETNPGLKQYSSVFFTQTDAALAATVVFGTASLFLVHWIGWTWPALVDLRQYWAARLRSRTMGVRQIHVAVALFAGVTLIVSALMAAIFIRNEGNKTFPASVPDYFRLLATADPVLFVGVALIITAAAKPALRGRLETAVAAAKLGAILIILISPWPGIAAGAEYGARGYRDLGGFLHDHGVTQVYSEAAFVLGPNLPEFEWHRLTLDFSGPFLNYTNAGVPQNGTIVTVGWADTRDFAAAGFTVFLAFDPGTTPPVHNPFFEH